MVKPLTVYKASAGSGKTFALAVHYIKLVVNDPQSYRNILAVTFTNKATEEMKTRILSQLYGIWKQLPDSAVYTREVCTALDATPQFVSERAGIALHLLLHNYNHFRVMTIDTFFQSVFRNLARELDLPANLKIGLNDAQVEEMAVDKMIEELKTTDVVLQWILNYIMDSIADNHSWNVIGHIKQFGKTIFRDFYKDISKQLDDCLHQEGFFDRYTRTLREIRLAAKKRMASIADAFFDTLESEGLTYEDLANKRRGIASFFFKLREGVFDESIENATVANCLGNPAKWYAKSHPRSELIHSLADGPLGDLLRRAVEERPRQWRLYQSAVLTLQHLNQIRLLGNIDDKVRTLNNEANRFLLSDTQKLLSTLISDTDSPFIFEKIGTQLEHIMIDEFQDTSTTQWQNFRVLLLETMSHRDSENLIVGDVKQSIYRWRSGDWQLLNNIEQEFPAEMIRTLPLKTNRRSDRNVIDFNNAFFAEAARLEYDKLADQPDADQLLRAYSEVRQDIPDGKPADGYVRVELLPDADDYEPLTLTRLTDTVAALREAGVTLSRIAILVRTNSYIPLIADHLTEHLPGVSIVSDEAFRLDASLPVNIVIHALRVINNPADRLALAFVEKYCGTFTPPDDADQTPLYELVEQLFTQLSLQRYDAQSAFISAFFDQLRQYTADYPATVRDFLSHWDEEIGAKTIQSDLTDGIRIISIHKSKGLEFDYVLLPFCDWQLEKTGNVLWCHPAEAPFSELPLVPVSYSQKGMKGTIYESFYHHEHLQNVVDNLNLLYVAFTRARRQLYVFGRRAARNTRSEIIEQVLPALSLGSLSAADDGQPMVFEHGTPHPPLTTAATRQPQPTLNPFLQPSAPLSVGFTSFSSDVEFRQSNQSREFVAQGQDDDGGDDQQTASHYIQLGSILHRVFSTIRTTADIDRALRDLEDEGVIYDDVITLDRITTMLRKRLEHPKVADWFSDRWTLFNECTILAVDDGRVVERRPDRVMTDGSQWVVVDFKFGRPRDEYHQQVREYMQLLGQMGHTRVSGYLWYVYSNRIEEVKELRS